MSRKSSRVLVIDACVARAAGETEHPVSSACRACLVAVKDICHRVALSEELRQEWNEHQSRFTRKWQVSMATRHKPLQIVKTAELQLDYSGLSPSERQAVAKDQHLLEAALAADRVIVTIDDALRDALGRMPKKLRRLKTICWIHPVDDGVGALERL